jgi:excisionase family DNA binding protein
MLALLNQREAAELLSISERTLERKRVEGTGPRYVKAGRSVRYRQSDIETWINSRLVQSTSDRRST